MPTAVTPHLRSARVTRILLDTHFFDGCAFLEAASAWLDGAPSAAVLHYVAVCAVEDLAHWRHAARHHDSKPSALSTELRIACAGALPGIQRMLLADGLISLTVCAGPLQSMLSEQPFQADEVRIPLTDFGLASASRWDLWAVKLLARRCRRGTVARLLIEQGKPDLGPVLAQLTAQGFEWLAVPAEMGTSQVFVATYAPRWELRTTRTTHKPTGTLPQRCAVVGAGLAGASVAHALALRGWQVTVLDAHHQVASGASGLPVGLVVPHVSVDDNPRSRMSRVGVQLTLQHAQRLLNRGEDWNDSGVLEFKPEADRCLAASPALMDAGWIASGQTSDTPDAWCAGREDTSSLWHTHAGWIKPARLVAAWLAQPGIQIRHGTRVTHMQRKDGVWQLFNALGETLAQAEVVVVANAMGALPLLQTLDAPCALSPDILDKLRALQAVHGLVSHGLMPDLNDPAFAPFAVNGHGSLIANVNTPAGSQWYAGATYETSAARVQDVDQQHLANWDRLKILLPAAAHVLKPQFSEQSIGHWSGTRCVSHDRLPLVGPAQVDASTGMWLCIAMGSRGLSFAALCAELLAARMAAEPLPMEASLAKSLDLHRARRQRT